MKKKKTKSKKYEIDTVVLIGLIIVGIVIGITIIGIYLEFFTPDYEQAFDDSVSLYTQCILANSELLARADGQLFDRERAVETVNRIDIKQQIIDRG